MHKDGQTYDTANLLHISDSFESVYMYNYHKTLSPAEIAITLVHLPGGPQSYM